MPSIYFLSKAGCILTSLIVLICATSTLLTGVSMSALATNGKIQAGGPYYIISRNLGVELGGALGLLFYLGTTIAASMYVLGAVEAIQSGFHMNYSFEFDTQVYALILMVAIALIVSVGVKYVNMSASLFLGIVLVSIICLTSGVVIFASDIGFSGELREDDRKFFDNLEPNFTKDPDTNNTPTFFSLLALFYPSVTGIMAGSNRSSVLTNPSESIPSGTLAAILITTTIYLSVVWLFGSIISNEALIHDKLIVTAVTVPHYLVVQIGIVMSSLGAALQCMTGAPKLLTAIAKDGAIPFLKFVTSSSKAPIWCTWFIASIPTLAGNLDFITPIITMFFLLMYSGCNLSCFFLATLKSPNFRPTFRYFHWSLSLFGFIWCIALALVISWFTALAAIMLCLILYFYIRSQGIVTEWGDARQGFLYSCASWSLRALERNERVHAKNWRPHMLTMLEINDQGKIVYPQLLSFASYLKKGNGLNLVLGLANGCCSMNEALASNLDLLNESIIAESMQYGMNSYVQSISYRKDMSDSLWAAIRTTGLGKLVANTVLLPLPLEHNDIEERNLFETLKAITNMRKAIMLLKSCEQISYKQSLISESRETIDVWWLVYDGGLLLLIPFLISKSKLHKGKVSLRLFAVISNQFKNKAFLEQAIREHLQCARILATVAIVDINSGQLEVALRNTPTDKRAPETPTTPKMKTTQLLLSPKHTEVAAMMRDKTVQEVFFDKVTFSMKSDIRKETDIEPTLNAASLMNQEMRKHSRDAKLVVLNLPLTSTFPSSKSYTSYLRQLSEGFNNLLFVRGSGDEVVTAFG